VIQNYKPAEVRRMVEEYPALEAKADTDDAGMFSLLRLADLDYVLSRLPLEYWEVVLVHGLLGFSQEETAGLLNISQSAVSKRWRYALEELTLDINGGLD
jgi:DNA-directed RNA polymerase specialized sigma24 family protein